MGFHGQKEIEHASICIHNNVDESKAAPERFKNFSPETQFGECVVKLFEDISGVLTVLFRTVLVLKTPLGIPINDDDDDNCYCYPFNTFQLFIRLANLCYLKFQMGRKRMVIVGLKFCFCYHYFSYLIVKQM